MLAAWRDCGADFSTDFLDGAARYDWFYLQNPAGHARVFFLEDDADGSVVGVLGFGARTLCVRGVDSAARVAVDFVVHPAHRTFFPALALQRFGRDASLKDAAWVIGYPNDHSDAVMRRAGYRAVPFNRHARVVGFTGHLARYVPGAWAWLPGRLLNAVDGLQGVCRRVANGWLAAEWRDEFDAHYDALWTSLATHLPHMGRRDRAFLSWRFTARPGRRYRVLEIGRTATRPLCGYFVCERGVQTLSVVDLLLPSDPKLRLGAVLALVAAARRLGVTRVSIGLAAEPALVAALASAGFVERESGSMLVAMRAGDAVSDVGVYTAADFDT